MPLALLTALSWVGVASREQQNVFCQASPPKSESEGPRRQPGREESSNQGLPSGCAIQASRPESHNLSLKYPCNGKNLLVSCPPQSVRHPVSCAALRTHLPAGKPGLSSPPEEPTGRRVPRARANSDLFIYVRLLSAAQRQFFGNLLASSLAASTAWLSSPARPITTHPSPR